MCQTRQVLRRRRSHAKTVQVLGAVAAYIVVRLAARLFNHNLAARAVADARRHGRPLALLALDIDHFKAINDTYGHAAGDTVLSGVAKACRERLRESDLIGRIGGEEFAVLLAHADAGEALRVAEELREAIQKLAAGLKGL